MSLTCCFSNKVRVCAHGEQMPVSMPPQWWLETYVYLLDRKTDTCVIRQLNYSRVSKIMLFLLLWCASSKVAVAQDVLLSSLTASKGFRAIGSAVGDESGKCVNAAGDINNDGIGDIIIGAHQADAVVAVDAGISYVIFGRDIPGGASAFGDIQLTTGATALSPGVGFRILAAAFNDFVGHSGSSAGDINDDGIDDIILGAYYGNAVGGTKAGIAYVIFGRDIPGGAAAFGDIQLTNGATSMPANIGFRILGVSPEDLNGLAVGSAGDINNDGVTDIITGAPLVDISGSNVGVSYVIYGRSLAVQSTYPFVDIQLPYSALPSHIGFRIIGAAANDQSGSLVCSAGDVNGDGIGDVFIATNFADAPPSKSDAGITYVIFGRDIPGGAAAFGDVQLTSGATALSPNIGFRILGAAASDYSGSSISAAGDVNGDGIGDILIGARYADPPSGERAGITYVIFGRNIPGGAAAFGDIQLTTGGTALLPSVGFRILGAAQNSECGLSVSAAGDVNGDSIADVIIGAPYFASGSFINVGAAFVIFGRNIAGGAAAFGDVQLTVGTTPFPVNIGFRVIGISQGDVVGWTVGSARDVNGDGGADIIIGATGASSGRGITYVIFGTPPPPSSQPSSEPSRQPSRQPTSQPSRQPSRQPTAQPTRQPSRRPSSQPSRQPSTQPTRQPSNRPSTQPSQQPSVQPSSQPSTQPTQPSSQPTRQPSAQPSSQPSIQPSRQPSSQPSKQPYTQPSVQPSSQPSNQPSQRPTAQPSQQPSVQPTLQPTGQPSTQPSSQPSSQPSCQPTRQPSAQPTVQPTMQPSSQPSVQPSGLPSVRPSAQPTAQPSNQPSVQPLNQPSAQPTVQPSSQPTAFPSGLPSSLPSNQPTAQPSYQPSSQPSRQPSVQPTKQPSAQPSAQSTNGPSVQPSSQPISLPSSQPSVQPTLQPSSQPTEQPTIQPTLLPSLQPNAWPSSQPSMQPSAQPSTYPTSQSSGVPSAQPSAIPSFQPSQQPSQQPSAQPSIQPTVHPSGQPSSVPSAQPSNQPSSEPSAQPSSLPSTQPSSQPSAQPSQPSSQPSHQPIMQPTLIPSAQPTLQPSGQPSCHPSTQPTVQPSIQPSLQPTSQPTSQPSRCSREWVTRVNNTAILNLISGQGDILWVCGTPQIPLEEAFCVQVDAEFGAEIARFLVPWEAVTTVFPSENAVAVIMTGRTALDSTTTDIATCVAENAQLTCDVDSFPNMNIVVASHVPYAIKTVYFGTYNGQLSASVFNVPFKTYQTLVYTHTTMKTILISHVQSPPSYVGTFVAGTCVSAASVNYIFTGILRADSGIMTGMYVLPARGSIVNSAELVNAMALEETNPDSFIAGGMQLNDGSGMHAYLLCVNSFFNRVEYGVRYQARSETTFSRRLLLSEQIVWKSVVKGMALIGTTLFMTVDVRDSTEVNAHGTVCLAKVDITSGLIMQQVQIESPTEGLQCSRMTTRKAAPSSDTLFLYLLCTVTYKNNTKQVLIISVNSDLTLSVLPRGFRRYANETLRTERVAFNRVLLPLKMNSADVKNMESTLIVENGNPTRQPSKSPTSRPSAQLSSAPSSQPSSSPTAAPSISAEPSSQPSSSGPTNTYKPTVKPTQIPSAQPSAKPTLPPTNGPTLAPTRRPTRQPSTNPSTTPSSAPTVAPTRAPSSKRTVTPSAEQTTTPTAAPSEMPSSTSGEIESKPYEADATLVLGYCVAGIFAFFLLYQLLRWCVYKVDKLEDDQKLMAHMTAINLPAKPRYPIFSAFYNLFCTISALENDEAWLAASAAEPTGTALTTTGTAGTTGTTVLQETTQVADPAAVVESNSSTPRFVGAYINSSDYENSKENILISQTTVTNTISKKPDVNPEESDGAVMDTNTEPVPPSISQNEMTSTRQPPAVTNYDSCEDSAPSVYFSDDSSYLSDIVNNTIQDAAADSDDNSSVNSDISDICDNSSHSGSSGSDESDDTNYHRSGDDMV